MPSAQHAGGVGRSRIPGTPGPAAVALPLTEAANRLALNIRLKFIDPSLAHVVYARIAIYFFPACDSPLSALSSYSEPKP
jgi:hypothetical protein